MVVCADLSTVLPPAAASTTGSAAMGVDLQQQEQAQQLSHLVLLAILDGHGGPR